MVSQTQCYMFVGASVHMENKNKSRERIDKKTSSRSTNGIYKILEMSKLDISEGKLYASISLN